MNPIPQLTPHLKQLRLSGILDSLEARNRQAIESKLAYTEFLSLLIQDEVARREQKKFALRLRRATFRTTKTIEQFDFERLPARRYECSSQHPLGSARIGSDPRASVCDPDGRVWDAEELYVVDGSVLPTSLGVNPQETVMAMATRRAF